AERSAPRSQPSEAFAEAWRNRQREQIREALGTLPEEQLKILELAYFSGYTHVEISNLLALPLGTVKGRMRLGLKKVSGLLRSRGLSDRTDQGRADGSPARADSSRRPAHHT
ncbi:MAG TPA: sigma factor-like helix-turn-helix DNA-binding protein, partial [Rubrobacter sp.]|nr:sigma factor-like helix-turn-helix DNA-binding protein [Rubrobacter sp.]